MRLIHSEEVQLGHGKGCRGVDVQIKWANDENGKACEDHVVPTLMEQQLWVSLLSLLDSFFSCIHILTWVAKTVDFIRNGKTATAAVW